MLVYRHDAEPLPGPAEPQEPVPITSVVHEFEEEYLSRTVVKRELERESIDLTAIDRSAPSAGPRI